MKITVTGLQDEILYDDYNVIMKGYITNLSHTGNNLNDTIFVDIFRFKSCTLDVLCKRVVEYVQPLQETTVISYCRSHSEHRCKMVVNKNRNVLGCQEIITIHFRQT